MKKITSKILSDEHQNILKIIEILECKCDLLGQEEINKEFFEKVIRFIRNYADKFHHAKEEDILFKEFNKCAEEGCVHCNPVEQMLLEHELGRGFVKGMEDGLREGNKKKLTENAGGYCQLLREHILKEDSILYPMADEALSQNTQKSMGKKFKKVESKMKTEKEKCLNLLKSIKT